jgi:hypothetical protein
MSKNLKDWQKAIEQEFLSELLPEEVFWGDPVTPGLLKEVLIKALRQCREACAVCLNAGVRGVAWHAAHDAVVAADAVLAQQHSEQRPLSDRERDVCDRAVLRSGKLVGIGVPVAQPAPEPVAVTTRGHLAAMENGYSRSIVARDPRFVLGVGENDVPLYAHPPTVTLPPLRELSDEELWAKWNEVATDEADEAKVATVLAYARAVLRAAGVEVKS